MKKKPIVAPLVLDMHSVYEEAIEELHKPYPSIRMNEWGFFTQITGGFRPREFSILCGSTGAGKTTWLANLSAQLLKQNEKHFVLSVETGRTDYMKRIMSAMIGRDLNTGEPVGKDVIAKFQVEYGRYLASNAIQFSLYEDRFPVEQLISDIEHMAFHKGCKIAIVDNLNFFMEVTKAADQIIEMDRVIHELIIFCKQVDVHIIMVMHPKKSQGTKSTRVESEYDIKGSSTAVQEAHNVLLFNRPSEGDIDSGVRNPHDRELKIAKMRRRGAYVGRTLVYKNIGTQYQEVGIF